MTKRCVAILPKL